MEEELGTERLEKHKSDVSKYSKCSVNGKNPNKPAKGN